MSELGELYARLYLDQDVPVQLAGMLRAHGFDVETTLQAGHLGWSDEAQIRYASASGRVMVTHNRLDFEELHSQWLEGSEAHSGIIVAQQRTHLALTLHRLLELLNEFDGEQLKNRLLYG